MTTARRLAVTLLGATLALACERRGAIRPYDTRDFGGAGSASVGTTGGGTGASGTVGTAGANGAAGTVGTAGANGAAGTVGTAGANGAAGTVGTAGANGTAGASNAAGATGAAGDPNVGATGIGGTSGEKLPALGWVERTPMSGQPSPSPRRDPAMMFDAASGTVLLYGGYAGALPVRDTWEWDGVTWTMHHVSAPDVFDGIAVTYDLRRDQVVMFGGETFPSAAPSSSLWQWSGDDWTAPPPAANGLVPAPRVSAKAAYDYDRDRVVIHGGGKTDTWEWAPGTNTWTNRTALTGGPGDGPFAWDLRRQVGVLFGGATGNELWELNGATGVWRQVAAVASWPSPRQGAGMVYDPDTGSMLLFGGVGSPFSRRLNDLWRWVPAMGAWVLLDDGSGPKKPAPRDAFGMTYDLADGRLVVFGGGNDSGDFADVWTYQASP